MSSTSGARRCLVGMLYLPTEEALAEELKKERRLIEER
jgi:hypothetical protein